MRALLLFLLFLPFVAVGQPNSYQQKADSLVVYLLGNEIFEQYVTLDQKKSHQHPATRASLFHYTFQHPRFSKKNFTISFELDSLGKFIPSEKVHGLIKPEAHSDSNWISAQQALTLCRDQAYWIKKRSLRLTWESINASYETFSKTGNFHDIVPGDLMWEIDGVVEFRGDHYSGTFKVNVFTGAVARHFAIPWD